MKPKKQKQSEVSVALKLPDDPETIAWLEEWRAQFKPVYETHVKLTKQLEEIIDLFQQGDKNRVLEIMRAHESLPELFLVCLEYVCRDSNLEAKINAQIRHAPSKSAAMEMKSLYLERLVKTPKLTKKEFAIDQNALLVCAYAEHKKNIDDLAAQIEGMKSRLADVDVGDSITRSLHRQEIKESKAKLVEMKKALTKPYPPRTIAGWLGGVQPLTDTALD